MSRVHPRCILFPYSTLFRSGGGQHHRTGSQLGADLLVPDVGLVLRRHAGEQRVGEALVGDRKSTRLNSSHVANSYAVFCLKKKNIKNRKQNKREKCILKSMV